jgi:hypothetical protein
MDIMLRWTLCEKLLVCYSLGGKLDGLVYDRDISLSNTTTLSTDALTVLVPLMFTYATLRPTNVTVITVNYT